MNLKIVFSGILILFLVGFVSADLCKNENGYYYDCGCESREGGETSNLIYEENFEKDNNDDKQKDYEGCVDICLSKYSGYDYRRSDRLLLRTRCFEECRIDKSYSEEIRHIEVVEERGRYYSASFEDSVVITREYEDYYGEDDYEYSWLDKREYEIEKVNSYGSVYPRGEVYVYVPYDYSGEEEDRVYDWSVAEKEECDFWCWLGF
jgi:hypothetical protein